MVVALPVKVRCPQCGASMSSSVAGLCGACLLRLATLDEQPAPDENEDLARVDEWLKVKGQRIGNYELLDEIARGGMGIVYRARQVNASRVVALKIMLPQLLSVAGMLERFRCEVEAVARLDHPGILPIYEVGEHAGLPLFSMKFAEGGSLHGRLAPLAGQWQQIAALVARVARAVEHAHGRGILHRDLKPANILFDTHDTPMVADFGLAKIRLAEGGLTLPAAALGSPNYMAPEQVNAEFGEIGPPTDVYGLGAILYELLTGCPPVAGSDALETLRLVATQRPRPGVEIRSDIPADLDAIALKCLAKRPTDRYATALDLALDLERWMTTGTANARRERAYRFAPRGRLALIGIAAMALGVIAWLGLRQGDTPLEPTPESAQETPAVAPRMLAVMPFRDLAGAGDRVVTLITDGLVRELRQIESVNVVSVDPGKAGGYGANEEMMGRLAADLRLQGEVERVNGALRLRTRLLDGRADLVLWEQEVTRPPEAANEMHAQVAGALAAQLRSDTREAAWARFQAGAAPTDSEADATYLRARALIRWRRPETLREAVRLLRAAIARDPAFARAHSSLAYAYALWPPPAPPEGDHWTLAVQFAQSALALDPALGEPHAVLGHYYTDRAQPNEAEPHLRRALELNPRDPVTLHFYAMHLHSVGRLGEALRLAQRGVALDSSNPQTIAWLAKMTTRSGDRDEALRLWRQADALGAPRPLCAAIARLDLGQSEPLAEYYRETFGRTGVPEGMRDPAVLLAGVVDESRRAPALAWLRAVEPHVDPAFAITHYAILGDADAAYRVGSTYNLADDFWYLYQIVNIWATRTESLRRDARFGTLLERWGYVDYWRRFGKSELCEMSAGEVKCR